jgi:hypothetical protein
MARQATETIHASRRCCLSRLRSANVTTLAASHCPAGRRQPARALQLLAADQALAQLVACGAAEGSTTSRQWLARVQVAAHAPTALDRAAQTATPHRPPPGRRRPTCTLLPARAGVVGARAVQRQRQQHRQHHGGGVAQQVDPGDVPVAVEEERGGEHARGVDRVEAGERAACGRQRRAGAAGGEQRRVGGARQQIPAIEGLLPAIISPLAWPGAHPPVDRMAYSARPAARGPASPWPGRTKSDANITMMKKVVSTTCGPQRGRARLLKGAAAGSRPPPRSDHTRRAPPAPAWLHSAAPPAGAAAHLPAEQPVPPQVLDGEVAAGGGHAKVHAGQQHHLHGGARDAAHHLRGGQQCGRDERPAASSRDHADQGAHQRATQRRPPAPPHLGQHVQQAPGPVDVARAGRRQRHGGVEVPAGHVLDGVHWGRGVSGVGGAAGVAGGAALLARMLYAAGAASRIYRQLTDGGEGGGGLHGLVVDAAGCAGAAEARRSGSPLLRLPTPSAGWPHLPASSWKSRTPTSSAASALSRLRSRIACAAEAGAAGGGVGRAWVAWELARPSLRAAGGATTRLSHVDLRQLEHRGGDQLLRLQLGGRWQGVACGGVGVSWARGMAGCMDAR